MNESEGPRILGLIIRVDDIADGADILEYVQKRAQLIYVKMTSPDNFLVIQKIPKRRGENAARIK